MSCACGRGRGSGTMRIASWARGCGRARGGMGARVHVRVHARETRVPSRPLPPAGRRAREGPRSPLPPRQKKGAKARRKVARKARRKVARKTRGNVARRTSCWRRCSWASCCASRRRRLPRRRSPDCPAYGQRPCSVVPWWRGSGVVSQARAHEQQQHAHTHPAFHVSQGTLASLLLHPGHSLHRVLLREKPCEQQTNLLCFGGPSPGNPSVALNATCTSNPRRTAPSTGKHSLLFCLAVRTAYCTAEPTFVGAAAVGNCAAPPDSIGEHEDRRAKRRWTAPVRGRRRGPTWWPALPWSGWSGFSVVVRKNTVVISLAISPIRSTLRGFL